MKKFIVTILFIASFFFLADVSQAQNLSNWGDVLDNAAGGSGAGYDIAIKSPEPIIATIIKALLSFLGVMFLVLMVYGGFLWMFARGNEEQVKKSRDLIIAAVIGLIIVLLSYAISIFVIDALTETTLTL